MAENREDRRKAEEKDRRINDAMLGFAWHVFMPRASRNAPGGMVFHVLYRGVGRMRLEKVDRTDYSAVPASSVSTSLTIHPIAGVRCGGSLRSLDPACVAERFERLLSSRRPN